MDEYHLQLMIIQFMGLQELLVRCPKLCTQTGETWINRQQKHWAIMDCARSMIDTYAITRKATKRMKRPIVRPMARRKWQSTANAPKTTAQRLQSRYNQYFNLYPGKCSVLMLQTLVP